MAVFSSYDFHEWLLLQQPLVKVITRKNSVVNDVECSSLASKRLLPSARTSSKFCSPEAKYSSQSTAPSRTFSDFCLSPRFVEIRVAITITGGSVAEWLACWTHQARRRARVQIAVATLSGNSLRQTVHTHCAFVHQTSKIGSSPFKGCGGNCRPGGK